MHAAGATRADGGGVDRILSLPKSQTDRDSVIERRVSMGAQAQSTTGELRAARKSGDRVRRRHSAAGVEWIEY